MNSLALPSGSSPAIDRAAAIWAALAQIFGRKFLAEYGERPNAMWRREIDSLTDAELSRGLERCRREGGEFAPALGQFSALCRDSGARRTQTTIDHAPPSMRPWEASLNLLLFSRLQRAGGVAPDVLRLVLQAKAQMATDLAEMYPDEHPPEAELRDLTASMGRRFDEILAGDRKPTTADEYERWLQPVPGDMALVRKSQARTLAAWRA